MIEAGLQTTPAATICFVSGHEFGRQALLGLTRSAEMRSGRLRCPLVLALDPEKAAHTVGFARFDDVAISAGAEHRFVGDGTLRADANLIRSCRPDYLVVIGWSRIVDGAVLDIPMEVNDGARRNAAAFGGVGMHPTLLPEGRGQAPIPWSIIKGLTRSGLSVFRLENTVDAGGLVFQLPIGIAERETATSLFRRFARLHYEAGARLAPLLAARRVPSAAQDLAAGSVWPRRRPADGRIDFRATGTEIDRLVRALTAPYPPATFVHHGTEVAVDEVRVHPPASAPPGAIVSVTDVGLPLVACGDATVEVVRLRAPTETAFTAGERVQTARDETSAP